MALRGPFLIKGVISLIPPRISPDKLKRIKEENENLPLDYIEKLAAPILVDLTSWANSVVYSHHNGNLTWEIPLFESANASAVTELSDPMSPIIRINLGMLREIYRDAFVFPLTSSIIAENSSTVKDLNKTFKNDTFTFDTGVPLIPPHQHTALFKLLKPIYDERRHEKLTDDMLASRFLMFELMIVWLFCHELGHLLQRHYLLQVIYEGGDTVSISEAREDVALHSKDTDENFFFKAQAREILADLEGVSFAVTYMARNRLLSLPSIYMLLCAQEIMFQRFSVLYQDNFDIPDLKHPHPLIRSEFVQAYSTHVIMDAMVQMALAETKDSVVMPMLYMSVRSSLMSGLFWANRYEVFDDNNRPTFLRLSDEQYHQPKRIYLETMAYWVDEQIDKIKPNHLCDQNFIEYFQGLNLFKQQDTSSTD